MSSKPTVRLALAALAGAATTAALFHHHSSDQLRSAGLAALLAGAAGAAETVLTRGERPAAEERVIGLNLATLAGVATTALLLSWTSARADEREDDEATAAAPRPAADALTPVIGWVTPSHHNPFSLRSFELMATFRPRPVESVAIRQLSFSSVVGERQGAREGARETAPRRPSP